MRDRFRTFDSKITFFAFADIITAVSGMLIFITLLLATDLGRPTDSRSQAANAELERQLQDTLAQQVKADAENRGLQQLLTTANTAPAPDKLESDISRLRAELADEKNKHAGMAEQLAASKTALEERDKLLGITTVQEQIQQSVEDLQALAQQDAKVREETASLEQQITRVESRIVKLRSREGQLWLIPDRSTTSKQPILAIVSGSGVTIERFNHPDETQQFGKSGASAGFENYLKHAKAADQYVVFLIRPSGIGVFKDLVQTARDKGFEVGFDALEENREIHFTTPPPIDDEAVPEKRSAGAPGASASPPPPSSAGPIGTNVPAESSVASASTTSPTNSLPPPPAPSPPPPKPKSWWQRFSNGSASDKMNLRRRKPHDSLYMLLDTMCNAFGGIILLAVLVVLLTSREKIQNAAAADSTEMLQRRVALAQTNLQQSLQLAASLHAKAGDDRWKTQVSLLATRQQLEDEIKFIRELAAQNAKQLDANAGSDPTERLKKLDAQITEGELKKLEAQNKIAASEEEKKRVASRLDTLEKQMAEATKQSQQELRLPREHDTDRQVAYAIAIYGRIYFCRNTDMTRNETDITWTDKDGVEYADPRKTKGLDPVANALQLKTYFTTQAHNSVYVVFITAPDSFPTFIRAKQLAVESGLPYGWMPWRKGLDGDLSFSSGGTMPRPQ